MKKADTTKRAQEKRRGFTKKIGIMLCSQFCYLSMVTLLYLAYGFLFYQNCRELLPQIGGEYVRVLVQCQFFFGAAYFIMFLLHSLAVAYAILACHWLLSVFYIPVEQFALAFYGNDVLTPACCMVRYLPLLVTAVVLTIGGWLLNRYRVDYI